MSSSAEVAAIVRLYDILYVSQYLARHERYKLLTWPYSYSETFCLVAASGAASYYLKTQEFADLLELTSDSPGTLCSCLYL